ncbi:MAG: DUF4430 domain-containing protein [Clostridia bacterium]
MNRKIVSVVLIFILIFTITACDNSAKINEPSENEQLTEAEKTEVEDSSNKSQKSETGEETNEDQDAPKESSEDDNTSEDKKISDEDVSEDSEKEQEQEETPKDTISLSIEGPEDEIIYANDSFELKSDSMTALEILQMLQNNDILRFEYQGSSSTAYLKGIEDYYEFDYGPLSGWMIEQNGEFPLKSIGSLVVSPGDDIRFRYTKELGEDLTN